DQLLITHRNRSPTRRPQRIKYQKVSNRFRHAQARRCRSRIRELVRKAMPLFKRAHDRRTTLSLHRHHARPLTSDPTQLLHLVECFPHSDQTGTAARGVNNYIGQAPLQLLRELVSKRLLSFDAIGFFQCRDVEPTFLFLSSSDLSAAVSDQAIHQGHVSASLLTLDHVCAWCIARHEDVRLESRTSSIGRQCAGSISGGWNCQFP